MVERAHELENGNLHMRKEACEMYAYLFTTGPVLVSRTFSVDIVRCAGLVVWQSYATDCVFVLVLDHKKCWGSFFRMSPSSDNKKCRAA
jgi:hypothetical protein